MISVYLLLDCSESLFSISHVEKLYLVTKRKVLHCLLLITLSKYIPDVRLGILIICAVSVQSSVPEHTRVPLML